MTKNMISIQIVGFNQKHYKKLSSTLKDAISEDIEILEIDCFEDLLNLSITGTDITLINFSTCQSAFMKNKSFSTNRNIIICYDNDQGQFENIMQSQPIYDAWDINNLNRTQIYFSINNLLKEIENKKQIDIIQSELEQYKLIIKQQDTPGSNVKLEEQLREMKRAFNYSPCAVVIVNPKGEIEYVNPEFSKITGYSSKEAIGQNPRILKSGVHDKAFYDHMWNTLLKGEIWRGDLCNKAKDGSHYWERVAMIPLKDQNDKIKYFVVIRVDDMERRRAEDAIRKADVLKTIRELAGGIAHEFSQPLQVLTINSALMENLQGQNRLVERNEKMIRKISQLVDNLKNLTDIKKKDYLDHSILDIKASASDESLEN